MIEVVLEIVDPWGPLCLLNQKQDTVGAPAMVDPPYTRVEGLTLEMRLPILKIRSCSCDCSSFGIRSTLDCKDPGSDLSLKLFFYLDAAATLD